MNQQELKKLVGQAALKYVKEGEILGVGTGSTVDCFIDALKASGMKIPACVSSSERSTQKLLSYGFNVLDLNEVERIGVYVDGADEIDSNFAMIKGGGGALTREKIVAMVSDRFVCIADASKKVDVLEEDANKINALIKVITTKVLENANMFLINSTIYTFTVTKIIAFRFFLPFFYNN